MAYIYFRRGRSGRTGRNIRNELRLRSNIGVTSGRHRTNDVNSLIRWGSTEAFGEVPTHILNPIPGIENASNKLRALEIIRDAGIRIPWMSTNAEDAVRFISNNQNNIIARTTNHQGGNGLEIFGPGSRMNNMHGYSHYLELIPIYKEYRFHVFRGEVIGISKKTDEGVEDRITDRRIRNHTNGWRFSLCDSTQIQNIPKQMAINAVNALGLDFGAVDIILSTGEETTSESGGRKYYVLEVNTAPALEPDSTIFNNYIEKFREWISNPTNIERLAEPENDEDDVVFEPNDDADHNELNQLEDENPVDIEEDDNIIQIEATDNAVSLDRLRQTINALGYRII